VKNNGFQPPVLRSTAWIMFFVVLIAAFVRIYPLKHEALSGDELFSARVAESHMRDAYIMVRDDLVHPPLYYLFLKIGIAIAGKGMLGLRWLSLVAGLLTIPLVWLVGLRLGSGNAAGPLAAAIVSLSAYDIYYSQEARSYAIYTLLVLLFALWLSVIVKKQSVRLWTVGAGLIAMLLYVHYVAVVYVFFGMLALCLSDAKFSVKKIAVAITAADGILFLPWLYVVSKVYHLKHGVGDNLNWQGHPRFYDLKMTWALSLGIPDIKGATTLIVGLVFLLVGAALFFESKHHTLRRNILLSVCLLLGVMVPLTLFLLSRKPINLPLFGLRHLLPSTVLLCLACCYGLARLSDAAGRYGRIVFPCGAVLLLIMVVLPESNALLHRPARFPYDAIETQVVAEQRQGIPAYTTWFYGIGEPVDFYCDTPCVADFSAGTDHLPREFLFLYRPKNVQDVTIYRNLLAKGFLVDNSTYYTNGGNDVSGTIAATMERNPHPILRGSSSLLLDELGESRHNSPRR